MTISIEKSIRQAAPDGIIRMWFASQISISIICKPLRLINQYRLCKSSVLIVGVHQKNVNLAYLLANALIAVLNLKGKDVVAGLA